MARKKLLIAALIVGLFGAVLVYMYSQRQQEKVDNFKRDQVKVIKAARTIEAGAPLTEEKVTVEDVPKRFLPANYISQKQAQSIYYGQPVSQTVQEDSMILTSAFDREQVASTLSANVPPKERAMTIPVNNISGVAGLLRPGNRVDILGTFPVGSRDQVIKEAGGGQSVGYVTMTLLQNVTLLAVGKEISGVGTAGQANSGRRRGYGSVTPSVTIDEAELLTIAQTRGDLTLLLRNDKDVKTGTIKRKTLKKVLKNLEIINRERRKRIKKHHRKKKDDSIKIYRGGH